MRLPRIEENPGESLYREYFYPCRTLELHSKDDSSRKFVEYSEATDYGPDLRYDRDTEKMALSNAVRRLLSEKNESFFYKKGEDGADTQVIIEGISYWLKAEDITEKWPNHYWTKTKKPLIGFKTIKKNGEPILPSSREPLIIYKIGNTYSYKEKEMIEGPRGYYFSLQLEKALQYYYNREEEADIFLVVAWGLIFIKNEWNDMGAQNLKFVRRLTKKDIALLSPTVYEPKAIWTGEGWASKDEDFCYDYLV